MTPPLLVVWAGSVPYRRAWAWQRALVAQRSADDLPDVLLLLEHPHVYTIGKRGTAADILITPERLAAQGADVVASDRGGQVTYHGPGQLVGYPIVRLRPAPQVSGFVNRVLDSLVATARTLDVPAQARHGKEAGVWARDAKLAAVGLRVSRGVTSHGFALNCATDLKRFDAIVACGLPERRACSLTSLLGRTVTTDDIRDTVAHQLAAALDRVVVAAAREELALPDEDWEDPDLPATHDFLTPNTAARRGVLT